MKQHFPRSTVDINLSALLANQAQLQQLVQAGAPGRQMMAIIKRDAYGHGMRQVARALEDRVDAFGLATVDEGIDLRMAGIRKPILILAPPDEQTAAAYVTHNLTATISDDVHFSLLMDGTAYHLEFDTGMRRLGFRPEEAEQVRRLAVMNQRLTCAGIFSHYATSHDPGSAMVHEQHRQFKEVLTHFPEVKRRHISNTGGALFYADTDLYDMVRVGIGLMGYGAGNEKPVGLTPVKTWRSSIVQTQEVKAGESVSYGATWRAKEDGFIGVVPAGYADGIPRALSNKLEVSIEGRRYPIAGVVTMDYVMVDLGRERLLPRSEVTLLGGDAMDAVDWARLSGTNVHEILTFAGHESERRFINPNTNGNLNRNSNTNGKSNTNGNGN